MVARAAKLGVPVYTSSPGDSSIGMNVAWHELMNDSRLMIDPNLDVNEVCAIILAGKKNGCVILGGGSPKNFYLQGQPTLWEVYGIPKGGNEFFIQITTDQVVWGGLSGATPSEAVSWGKVNPGVLPDTVVAYCDSTIAFPLFCEYAVGSKNGTRKRKELYHQREALVAELKRQGRSRAREAREDALEIPSTSKRRKPKTWARSRPSCGRSPRIWRPRRASTSTRTCRPASSRSCATSFGWDVLFVLEHDDLRRAPDIEHFRRARELGRTLDHARSRLLRRPPVPARPRARRHRLLARLTRRRSCKLLRHVDRDDPAHRAGGAAPAARPQDRAGAGVD